MAEGYPPVTENKQGYHYGTRHLPPEKRPQRNSRQSRPHFLAGHAPKRLESETRLARVTSTPPPALLTGIVKQAAALTDSVCVGFSTGKDSIVALDLCRRHFKQVTAFFMYVVPGLSFQEAYLAQAERRYGIKIVRLPHWSLSTAFQVNYYRPGSDLSAQTPEVGIVDAEAMMRRDHGATWFAYGQKKNDSLERRGMISACGGVDVKSRRLYPVGDFSDKAIFAYMKHRRLPVPIDYQLFGHSFGILEPLELRQIRQHYPSDFAKIIAVFPEIEACIAREDFYGEG